MCSRPAASRGSTKSSPDPPVPVSWPKASAQRRSRSPSEGSAGRRRPGTPGGGLTESATKTPCRMPVSAAGPPSASHRDANTSGAGTTPPTPGRCGRTRQTASVSWRQLAGHGLRGDREQHAVLDRVVPKERAHPLDERTRIGLHDHPRHRPPVSHGRILARTAPPGHPDRAGVGAQHGWSRPHYPSLVPGWTEVADGVLQRRYQPWDVNVCVVRGDEGLLVVDTRATPRQGGQLREDLRELGDRPVRWVVNTHAHFDHTFGNQAFTRPEQGAGPDGYGHALVPEHLERYERPMLAQWLVDGEEPADELAEVVITPPTVLVTDRHVLDVGGRAVELVHLGRGHTDNDLLLHVPSASVWLVGDVVVPGHGRPVDAHFAEAQAAELQQVADLLLDLHAAGVPVQAAYDEGGDRWPFPLEALGTAAEEAYAHMA